MESSYKANSKHATMGSSGSTRVNHERRFNRQPLSSITEQSNSELTINSSLRAPLLHSGDPSTSPMKPFSKCSSYDDIEEMKGVDSYHTPSEKISEIEKQKPRMMIPLPMPKHNQQLFRVKVLFKFSLPILVYSISNLLIETFTLLFAGQYLGYKALAAIGKSFVIIINEP